MRESRPSIRVRNIASLVGLLMLVVLTSCSGGEVVAPEPAALEPINGLETRRLGLPSLQVLSPSAGAEVTSPVQIEVNIDNYHLAPKGVSRDGEGHLHVVLGSCIQPGEVIADEHVHLGDGSAVAEVELVAGYHQLCVQLGDGFHTAVAVSEEFDLVVTG